MGRHQQTSGPIALHFKGLGMLDAQSNFRSMSGQHDQGSSGWSWNQEVTTAVGSGSGLADWYGLLSTLNSIIIVSNSCRADSVENNPLGIRKGLSISESHKGTCGHFFTVDCVSSTSITSAIDAGSFVNSRVRYPDCLEEAIRWRKHVLDRG